MKNKENLQAVGAITIILGAFATLVLSPVLTFWFAYLGGMILNYFVGGKIKNG